ncbi:MAG: zinc-ribbon domain-containing protein, partial [Rubrivivax sp.]|nr:zinc-ribbon domain-containing protein [Rubrivivax sp.]
MAELCPTCGVENRDSAKFCRGCGRSLVPLVAEPTQPTVACPACASPNSPGATFCTKCGRGLHVPPALLSADTDPPPGNVGSRVVPPARTPPPPPPPP